MTHLKIVSFTETGRGLGERLARSLPGLRAERYARGADESLRGTFLPRFAQQAMFDCDGVVFIGAAGIAVRAVAPYLRGKAEDPAVLVLDEAGRFVIPLLSGHLGGANALAGRIARAIGAAPVLTTATDVRGVFAADTWAAAQGLRVADPAQIRFISAALLRGETVGLRADISVAGEPPAGVAFRENAETGIWITAKTGPAPFAHTLRLIPRAIVAGMGCRRGKPEAALAAALDGACATAGIDPRSLAAVASIDRKADEPGLVTLAASRGVPFLTFTAEALRAVPGEFTPSGFARQAVGVDNVCERAAAAAGGKLICRKTVWDGVTVALAERPMEVSF